MTLIYQTSLKEYNIRRGRIAAVSATARKLGVILWTMIVKKVPYQPPTQYLFLDEKRKLKIVKQIRKTIAKFDISTTDLQIGNKLISKSQFAR